MIRKTTLIFAALAFVATVAVGQAQAAEFFAIVANLNGASNPHAQIDVALDTRAGAAGRQNLKGIEWQFETPLMSGDGSSYKAYFVIEAVEPPVEAVAERTVPIESTGPVVKAGGRVPMPAGTARNPPLSKCEAAQQARARNSPAAPGLEALCLAIVNALAARGEAIANQDPSAVALRNQQPEGLARRGFDIGMAAAEGQTAPGPGKQSIHDSLPAAEQGGFTAAVSFSLARNKNAKLAATGAAIAEADPVVAQSRNNETDPFYRLGFDIATGIFGDPAQGALGNTATGPGSLGIRDSLSAAGQRGFNGSVALHLSRKYKR